MTIMDIEMSAQSFGILGLHTDDDNFAAGVALCNMLDGDERFIKSLPVGRPTLTGLQSSVS